MEKPKIWFVIGMLIVAATSVIYLIGQKTEAPSSVNVIDPGHTPELRSGTGFAWFKHWDQLDLAIVKRFYQRYTLDEMQILWSVKLLTKYGNYAGKAYADTAYPWETYLTRLLELGHPFLDFSDYESALDTRTSILIPTRTYWHAMNKTERIADMSARGLPPDTTWETYQEYLIKQIAVYRINWWRSGGMDPFSKHGNN